MQFCGECSTVNTTSVRMSDFLDILARTGSLTCRHVIPTGTKCSECNVILYDSVEYVKDASFADLLVASPRRKRIDDQYIQGQMDMLRSLNDQLDRSSIVYQREYIEANIAKTRTARPRVVTHSINSKSSRAALFPKIAPAHVDEFVSEFADVPDVVVGVISLASADSPSRTRLQIILAPYGPDSAPVVVDIDESVSGADLIQRLLSEARLDLDAAKQYVFRWLEDEDEMVPDMDLPYIDPNQPLTSINTNVLCLCDIDYDNGTNESDDSSI
jgi:hypothetical protein